MANIHTFLGLALCIVFCSASFTSNDPSKKSATSLNALVEKAFKSGKFVAAGNVHAKQLEATYSTTGSVYQNMYYNAEGTSDTTCSSLSSTTGIRVNLCIPNGNYWFKFQLVENSCTSAVIQYYGDLYCQHYLGSSGFDDYTSGCQEESDQVYYNLQCSTSAQPVVAANNLGMQLYATYDCSALPIAYSGYALGKCLPEANSTTSFYSYTCNGATASVNYYTNSQCNGTARSAVLPSSCVLNTNGAGFNNNYTNPAGFTDDMLNPPPSASTTAAPTLGDSYGGYYTASTVYCPVAAPTLMPAFAPSAFPTTSGPKSVTFDVKQILYGIDATTLLASSLYILTLQSTIAATMAGVAPADVTKFAATEYYRRSRRLGSSAAAAAAAATTTAATTTSDVRVNPLYDTSSAVVMTYTLNTQSVYSSDQLFAALAASVNSGAFTTALNVNAQVAGATGLVGTSSNFVTIPIGDIDTSDSLSSGAIAGIVIGAIVFAALVLGAVYYFCCRRRPSSPMSTHGGNTQMTAKSAI